MSKNANTTTITSKTAQQEEMAATEAMRQAAEKKEKKQDPIASDKGFGSLKFPTLKGESLVITVHAHSSKVQHVRQEVTVAFATVKNGIDRATLREALSLADEIDSLVILDQNANTIFTMSEEDTGKANDEGEPLTRFKVTANGKTITHSTESLSWQEVIEAHCRYIPEMAKGIERRMKLADAQKLAEQARRKQEAAEAAAKAAAEALAALQELEA